MAQQRGWLTKKSFAHAETTPNFDNWLWNCRFKNLVGLGFHIRITGRWGFIPLSKKRWENHRFSAVSIYHALTILEYDHWDHQWLWMMMFTGNSFVIFFGTCLASMWTPHEICWRHKCDHAHHNRFDKNPFPIANLHIFLTSWGVFNLGGKD